MNDLIQGCLYVGLVFLGFFVVLWGVKTLLINTKKLAGH